MTTRKILTGAATAATLFLPAAAMAGPASTPNVAPTIMLAPAPVVVPAAPVAVAAPAEVISTQGTLRVGATRTGSAYLNGLLDAYRN
ncbi:hypothetical protein HKCCE3408_00070 [Rhodobacterales bacterium HKCCE3408]|nr:hypothetical protein [Rhodobacterales bacterium HKCCE3408]